MKMVNLLGIYADMIFKPTRNTKPTHKYMGELFLMNGAKLWIWSYSLNKWSRLWKSFDHSELVILFRKSDIFNIK